MSSAFIENYSDVPHGIEAETVFHTPADVDPARVLAIVNEAIAANRHIICKDEPPYDPMPRYKGVVNVNGQWVAAYSAGYRVKILPKKSKAKEDLWNFVRARFMAEGIPLMPAPLSPFVTVVADAPRAEQGPSLSLAAETPPPP